MPFQLIAFTLFAGIVGGGLMAAAYNAATNDDVPKSLWGGLVGGGVGAAFVYASNLVAVALGIGI